ncbi:homeobox protein 2-like [Macrobrachium nipponense]|uniref:homeobox protein 2-like n=1 Tax=Macrobrachium nipponense TaxID=159736 RepID=UPI0030C81AC7
MPEGGGSNDCHLCHIHDHAPASTLLRTHPLRASQSRSRNPSKSSITTLNRNLHHHHHHHHDGGHHSRDNGTIRDADAKSMRVASALAKLSERSHSLPGSRASTISRPNVVSVLPNGSPPEHVHRGNDVHSISRSQREYNNVLAALLDTRVGSLPSSHSASHREPDLLNALPRTRNNSRASTLSRGQLHHSNLTLAQDTEQDYYTHINRSRFKDEARKQRFNIQTVMLIGCYTMLFVVAIIVGVVLCQQNGWLGFGHGSSDEVSGNISDSPNSQDAGTSSMRDLGRSTRGRGNRGNWPGPTIDYDYPSDSQPPRINSAGIFPGGQGRGTNLQNTPGSKEDPLRTVNFQPTGPFDGPNGNPRRPIQRAPSPVGGGSTLGSGKSIADSRDESPDNGFGGNGQNTRNQNTNRQQSTNNNPFSNFANPGRTGTVDSDAPGRPNLQNFPGNTQRSSNQNTAGINNSNINQNRGSNPNSNGVNNRNFNGNIENTGVFPNRPNGNFASSNGNQRNQPNRNFDNAADNTRNSHNSNFNTGTGFEETNPSGSFPPNGQGSAVRNLNEGSNLHRDNLNGNSNTNGGRNFNNAFSSSGRGNANDGTLSNGRGNFNDGIGSNGRGNFNDGTGSNGGGNFNGPSDGRRNFNGASNSNGRGNFDATVGIDGSNFNTGQRGTGNFDNGASSGVVAGNSDMSSGGTSNFGSNGGSVGFGNSATGSSAGVSENFDGINSSGTNDFHSSSGMRGTTNANGGSSSSMGNFNSGSGMRGDHFDNSGDPPGSGKFEPSGMGPVRTFDNFQTDVMGDTNSGLNNRGSNAFNNAGSSGAMGNINSGSTSQGDNFNHGGGSNGFGNFNSGNDMVGVPKLNDASGTRGMSDFTNGDGPGGRGSSNNFGVNRPSTGSDNFNTNSGMGGSASGNSGATDNFNSGLGSSDHSTFNDNLGTSFGSGSASGGRNNFPNTNQGSSSMNNGDRMNQEQFRAGISVDNFSSGSAGTLGSQINSNGGSRLGTAGNTHMDFGMGSSNNGHLNTGTGNMGINQFSGGSNNNFDIPSAILGDSRLPTPIPGMFPQEMRDLGNGDRRRMPSGRNLNLQNLPTGDQSDSMLNKQSGGANSSPGIPSVDHGGHSSMSSGMHTKSSTPLNTGTSDHQKITEGSTGHNWEGQKAKGSQSANGNSGSPVTDGVSLPSSGPTSSGSQQPTNTFATGVGSGMALGVNGNQFSGQPTPEIPVTPHQGIITIPPSSGTPTPLKVMKGFTVQRGEVVAISTIKSSDKDISILQPDHDVIFHITPNAPDAGVSLIRHPNQDPNVMGVVGPTNTTTPRRGSAASPVLRRWEHTDHDGTLSRGLVRQDGSFAFTNCRPPESCGNSGSSGS